MNMVLSLEPCRSEMSDLCSFTLSNSKSSWENETISNLLLHLHHYISTSSMLYFATMPSSWPVIMYWSNSPQIAEVTLAPSTTIFLNSNKAQSEKSSSNYFQAAPDERLLIPDIEEVNFTLVVHGGICGVHEVLA